MSTQREDSHIDWDSDTSRDDINSGSFQRIADASERLAISADLMARDHAELTRMRDNYKRWWTEEKAKLATEKRRTAALRGVTGRMKRQQGGSDE